MLPWGTLARIAAKQGLKYYKGGKYAKYASLVDPAYDLGKGYIASKKTDGYAYPKKRKSNKKNANHKTARRKTRSTPKHRGTKGRNRRRKSKRR